MSIDSIETVYQSLLAELKEQNEIKKVSIKLLSQPQNEDKVIYLTELLYRYKKMPMGIEIHKSDSMSTHYRNLGNQHFLKSRNYEAWQYYNLALLHAPYGSENYTIAISNRSAVLFALKKYQECLNDIDTLFGYKYPERLKDKLLKRQEECRKAIPLVVPDEYTINKQAIDNILEMRTPKQLRYLCASPKLDVGYTEELGRHVVAMENIEPGEVIVEEDPYFALAIKSQILFSCGYCLSRSANLYPCHVCCFVLYCSMDCKRKAWKEYHTFECSLLPSVLGMEFTKLELLALRTTIKAYTDAGSWDRLIGNITNAIECMETDWQGHVCVAESKWIYDSKYYESIHSLLTNKEKRTVSDMFQKSVSAAVLLNLLLVQSSFLKETDDGPNKGTYECAADLLLRHIMTGPTNMHSISCNGKNKSGNYVDEVTLASAPYAFLSLLNHSCSPNVVRFNKLGSSRMYLLAIKYIEEGTQIFDNYGFHFAVSDRDSRRKDLSQQYKFNCMCEPCVQSWPLYVNLGPNTNLPPGVVRTKERLLSAHNLQELQKGNLSLALEIFKPLCILIKLLHKHDPSTELSDCQESLKQCLAIFGGTLAFGYCNCIIDWSPLESLKTDQVTEPEAHGSSDC